MEIHLIGSGVVMGNAYKEEKSRIPEMIDVGYFVVCKR